MAIKGLMAITVGLEAEFNAIKATFKPIRGELCWESDKQRLTIGDGTHVWENLTHYSLAGASGMSEVSALKKFIELSPEVAVSYAVTGTSKRGQTISAASGTAAEWRSEAPALTPTIVSGKYEPKTADSGSVLEINEGTEVEIKFITGQFEAGQLLELCQLGAGKLHLTTGAGFTLKTSGEAVIKTRTVNSSVLIRFRSATEGIVSGDTE